MTTQSVRAGAYPARTAPRSHHIALEGTMTTPTPPDDGLRQRIETALRDAAHVCGEDCPAPDEAACHAAHPVQEAVSHHGVVTDVYAPISALVEVLLPPVADALAARDAQTRAQALREAADLAHDEGTALYDDMGQKAAAGAWLVRDRLRARADGIHRTQS